MSERDEEKCLKCSWGPDGEYKQCGDCWREAVDEANRRIREHQSFKDAEGWISGLLGEVPMVQSRRPGKMDG